MASTFKDGIPGLSSAYEIETEIDKLSRDARIWSQSIPEDWLPYLDDAAATSGKTRVGFVRDLIREAIPTKYHNKLSQPQQAGRPKEK